MLSFSISYPDLIKFPYFVDITERGDRGWKAGDFMDNFNISQKNEDCCVANQFVNASWSPL